MKQKRLGRSITQKQAAQSCGLTPKRWSNLERGFRRPTLVEYVSISNYLALGDCFPIPSKANKTLLNQGARLTPESVPYFAPKDRHSHVRYRLSCRNYRNLTERLSRRICMRDDFAICQYLCHQIPSDSSLETLNILNLLVKGAVPALVAPSSLGHTPQPIVHPSDREPVGHRPQPCLIFQNVYNFYQVSFLAQFVKRVDILQWNGEWSVIEVNGAGHDLSNDHLRESAVGLTVRWKTEQDIIKEAKKLIAS